MLKYFAPSGSPIKTSELFYWILCTIFFIDKRDAIKEELKEKLQVQHSYLFTTGRGAMTLLLKSISQMNNNETRDEVIVPAYTCYSVVSSIMNANLKIRLCDIDPDTLTYDMDKLKKMPFDNVLCIVSANLYGMPNQLQELEELSITNNCFMIDDAAQAFGAKYNGRTVGTFGTAGVFSFDKGKNITSIEGGVVTTNNSQLAEIIKKNYEELPDSALSVSLMTVLKVFIYYLFLNPLVYWLPASLPFLNLGKTRFEQKISIEKYSRLVAPLAIKQIKRSNDITKKRVENGLWYKNNIQQSESIRKVKELDKAEPVYLRYAVKVIQKQNKLKILDLAKRHGVTVSYPKSLNRLKEIEMYLVNPGKFDGAEQIAGEIITIPTHSYIKEKDRKNIIKLLITT